MVAQIEVGIAAIAGLERLPLLEVGERDPSEIAAAVTQFLAAAPSIAALGVPRPACLWQSRRGKSTVRHIRDRRHAARPPRGLDRRELGLRPLVSMLNSIVAADSVRERWLLYGVRNDQEHIMRTSDFSASAPGKRTGRKPPRADARHIYQAFRGRIKARARVSQPARTLRAASTIQSAEIPAARMSSAGVPDPGRSRTAR
jgi:hypothetical protein